VFLGDPLQNGSPYAIGPLSCLCVLSVTLVYCGQTVGWIKMPPLPRAAEVGLGPGHTVLVGLPTFQPSNVKYRDARGAEDRDAEGVEGVGNGAGVSPPQPTRGLGSVVSSPSRIRGKAPAE